MSSRLLSYVLRHRPDAYGLTMDPEGWVDVKALLRAIKMTRADLDEIVRTDGVWLIEHVPARFLFMDLNGVAFPVTM